MTQFLSDISKRPSSSRIAQYFTFSEQYSCWGDLATMCDLVSALRAARWRRATSLDSTSRAGDPGLAAGTSCQLPRHARVPRRADRLNRTTNHERCIRDVDDYFGGAHICVCLRCLSFSRR
jgi:hypothetical protein